MIVKALNKGYKKRFDLNESYFGNAFLIIPRTKFEKALLLISIH